MAGVITSLRINPVNRSYYHRQSRLHTSIPLLWTERLSPRNCLIDTRSSKPLILLPSSSLPLETISSKFDNTLPSKEVREIWCNADAVCFDVDSTMCLDEGIDELADFCGAWEAVAKWTARSTNGSVPFEEALAARLSLFEPSLSQVQDFLAKRPPSMGGNRHASPEL